MMSGIRGKDTRPEVRVRSYLHRMGFRFRLHARGLPGRPDIVLRRYRTVVFIHGCFWHRHPGCRFAYTPKSNLPFWQKKFDENVARDLVKTSQLRKLGWRVRVIWECQTRDVSQLARLARDISKGDTC
jgi:DNA mismatch endonuclease, patch repair protein